MDLFFLNNHGSGPLLSAGRFCCPGLTRGSAVTQRGAGAELSSTASLSGFCWGLAGFGWGSRETRPCLCHQLVTHIYSHSSSFGKKSERKPHLKPPEARLSAQPCHPHRSLLAREVTSAAQSLEAGVCTLPLTIRAADHFCNLPQTSK